jgi:hypothetical protein
MKRIITDVQVPGFATPSQTVHTTVPIYNPIHYSEGARRYEELA